MIADVQNTLNNVGEGDSGYHRDLSIRVKIFRLPYWAKNYKSKFLDFLKFEFYNNYMFTLEKFLSPKLSPYRKCKVQIYPNSIKIIIFEELCSS